jgi:LmbE family N-acetylglucosaminyl deacetylase
MLKTEFRSVSYVLCLGAHADDIEIGCGGTVLRLVSQYPGAHFHWIVFSASGRRKEEAEASAGRFLRNARSQRVQVMAFRDGFFPYVGADIKEFFERVKSEANPDLIFSHHGHDRHQDHRLLAELTWNTFRDHLIWEYEIPKYDGDLGSPSVFVQLTREERRRKIDLLLAGFPSQATKRWFSEETFDAILRLRGVESNSPSGYAEGFYCRKLCCL